MEHYYSSNPKTPHDIKNIYYSLRGYNLAFMTDAGVFSRTRVDFGTDLLINSIPKLEGKVLDLGCGYGPIGISIAQLNSNAYIDMVDINKRAVALAKENILKNNITNARAFASDGFASVTDRYNAIITNPPIRAGKKLIYSLFEQSIDYLHVGGALYLVIQKKQGAPSAMKKLDEIFKNCTILARNKGYFILQCSKL